MGILEGLADTQLARSPLRDVTAASASVVAGRSIMNQITSWLYPNQFDLTTVMSTLALLIGASVVIVVLSRLLMVPRDLGDDQQHHRKPTPRDLATVSARRQC
jgi:hypothetical protein